MARWNPFSRKTDPEVDTYGRHAAPGQSKGDRIQEAADKQNVRATGIGGDHRRTRRPAEQSDAPDAFRRGARRRRRDSPRG
jgi:hypothetical protein